MASGPAELNRRILMSVWRRMPALISFAVLSRIRAVVAGNMSGLRTRGYDRIIAVAAMRVPDSRWLFWEGEAPAEPVGQGWHGWHALSNAKGVGSIPTTP